MSIKLFKLLIFSFVIIVVCCEKEGRRKKCCKKKSVTTASGIYAPKRICSGDLIFDENFDKFDFRKWSHENTLSGGGNWEFQWYTNNRSNSFVKDGRLYIKPSLTSEVIGEERLYNHTIDLEGYTSADYCTDRRFWGCQRTGTKERIVNPIRSAKITTINSFAWKYGKMTVRAKMPTGNWLWPAIWMLPRYNAYGPWPGSGTISLVEGRGNEEFIKDGINIGVEQVEANLHWGPDVTHDGIDNARFYKRSPGFGFNKAFRDYTLEWTPDYIRFYIDDELLKSVEPNATFWDLGGFDSKVKDNPYIYGSKMAPFDEEFYILINVAVGGIFYFPDTKSAKPWSNLRDTSVTDFWVGRSTWLDTWKLKEGDTAALQVEYIKIWAL